MESVVLNNRYRLLELVGSGGMAVVYRGMDTLLQRRVAVKVLRESYSDDPAFLARFRREAQAAANLDHPNVVTVYDVCQDGDRHYIVMEYVQGQDLKTLIRQRGQLEVGEALDIAIQIAAGVGHAHKSGVIHCDVKPQNVLVTQDGRAMVTDFGIARALSESGLTESDTVWGSPLYFSPEQAAGDPPSPASDVYSIGVVMYEMLAGRPPFDGEGAKTIFELILDSKPTPLREQRQEVPEELARLVEACLEKDRGQRPPNFTVVAESLEKIRSGLGALASVAPPFTACPHCSVTLPPGLAECPVEAACRALTRVESERVRGEKGLASRHATGRDSSLDSVTEVDLAGLLELKSAPRPEVRSFRIWPRKPSVGDTIAVEIVLANPGEADAADAELMYAVPNQEDFVLQSDTDRWQGIIRGREPERAALISYRFKARRAGSFPPNRVVLTWSDPSGGPQSLLCGTVPPLRVIQRRLIAFVGRDEACEEANRLLEAAAQGQSSLLMVRGGAGTGKSTFAERLMGEAEKRGFTVAFGCGVARSAETLKPFLDVVRFYLDLGEAVLTEEEIYELIVRRFRQESGGESTTGNFLARAVLGEERLWVASSALSSTPKEVLEHVHPHRWFRVVLRMAATSPLLIVLDDVHLSDSLTVELLKYLAGRCHESGARVLFCATIDVAHEEGGGPPVSVALRDLIETIAHNAPFIHTLELGNLNEEQIKTAIDLFFPGGDLPDRFPWLAESILGSTGGNPLFVSETLRDLRKGRVSEKRFTVRKADESWELGSGITPQWLFHHIPSGVEALLQVRLGKIGGDVAAVLEAAAVTGEEFEVEIVRRLVPKVGDEAFEEALDRLEAEALIRPVDRELTLYRFTHGLYHAAIEQKLVGRSRRKVQRLHRHVARSMQELYGSEVKKAKLLDIAEHLIAGGEREEGLQFLLEGIEYLHETERFYQCFEPLRRAQEVAATVPGTQPRLLWLETVTFSETGHLERALDSCRRYLALVAGDADDESLSTAHGRAGELCFRLGRPDEAKAEFNRSLECAQSAGKPILLSRAHNGLGLLAKSRQDFPEARTHLLESLKLYGEADDDSGACAALINLGNVCRLMGDARACERSLGEAVSRAETVGASHLQAGALLSLANLHLVEKRLDEAEVAYRESLRLYRLLGNRLSESMVLGNLALVCREQKRLDKAYRYYREAIRSARLIGHRPGELHLCLDFAWFLTETGRNDEASAAVEEARRLARELSDIQGEVRRILRRVGRVSTEESGESLFFLRQAERIAEECGNEEALAEVLREKITPCAADGAFLLPAEETVRTASRLEEIGRARNDRGDMARALAVQAIVAAREGDAARSRDRISTLVHCMEEGGPPGSMSQSVRTLIALAEKECGSPELAALAARMVRGDAPEAASGG